MRTEAEQGTERSGQRPGRERLWALVRIGLGLAQVMAATATAYFLVVTGTSTLTLWCTLGTAVLVLASKLLFRGPNA